MTNKQYALNIEESLVLLRQAWRVNKAGRPFYEAVAAKLKATVTK